MQTYEHVNKLPRWRSSVCLCMRTTQTLGTYLSVSWDEDLPQIPEYNIRLTPKQLKAITKYSASARTQRTIDSSREQVFRLLYCGQTVHLIPNELEQDTAPTVLGQQRLSCYSLVLDIIAKAMEKENGI